MRIYFSSRSDPMIRDTVVALNATGLKLREFIESPQSELFLPAETSGSPAPYEAFLAGVRFTKGDGAVLVELDPKLGLRVTASPSNLATWCSAFTFPDDATYGDHHHA